jgi:hypothetical protein
MKAITRMLIALALASPGSAVLAEDITSGLAVGKTMLSMPMEKRGGLDDGVKIGDAICYT